ncbi:hypothetical protein XENTR_v10015223 [Xenopus tropicalis]|nr:hypothetical protein XENTR_v10015223 [Xenopus tropicalis]
MPSDCKTRMVIGVKNHRTSTQKVAPILLEDEESRRRAKRCIQGTGWKTNLPRIRDILKTCNPPILNQVSKHVPSGMGMNPAGEKISTLIYFPPNPSLSQFTLTVIFVMKFIKCFVLGLKSSTTWISE